MDSAPSTDLNRQSDPLGARQSGGSEGPQSSAAQAMWPGTQLAQQALDYWTDACQRSVPFLDVMRQRGNNYFERAGVLGVRVPIILTSRADSVRTRMASWAGAALCVHSRRAARAGSGKLAG